jgi:hypothetical protein
MCCVVYLNGTWCTTSSASSGHDCFPAILVGFLRDSAQRSLQMHAKHPSNAENATALSPDLKIRTWKKKTAGCRVREKSRGGKCCCGLHGRFRGLSRLFRKILCGPASVIVIAAVPLLFDIRLLITYENIDLSRSIITVRDCRTDEYLGTIDKIMGRKRLRISSGPMKTNPMKVGVGCVNFLSHT